VAVRGLEPWHAGQSGIGLMAQETGIRLLARALSLLTSDSAPDPGALQVAFGAWPHSSHSDSHSHSHSGQPPELVVSQSQGGSGDIFLEVRD